MIYLKIFESLKNLWPFMQKHWKTLFFVIVSILAILFYLRGERFKKRAEDAEQGRDAAIKISNGLSSEVHRYKNKQGDTILVTKTIGVPESQVSELMKEKDLFWLKKFDELKKNGSNLVSAQTFTTESKEDRKFEKTVEIPCATKTIRLRWYRQKDDYNDINVLLTDSSKLERRDRYFSINDLRRKKGWLIRFQWSKRKKFEMVSELTNLNRSNKIDSLMEIEVKR